MTPEQRAEFELRRKRAELLPGTPFGAVRYALDGMLCDRADSLQRELLADCDPPAVARETAELVLLLVERASQGGYP